jgi:glycosyltransferase involved in cell wall biosynthesis
MVATARQCDVVHFNVPTPGFGVLADLVGLLVRQPMVVGFEAHLADVPGLLRRLHRAPEFYAPRLVINNGVLARATLRRAQLYVVSSAYQRNELLALDYRADQVRVIPNLPDTAKLQRWPREQARSALGLPSDPLVVFAGHFHDVKGHDVLVEAFRHVRGAVPGARLVLAWTGIGNQNRLRQQIRHAGLQDAVIELGRVDVAQLYSAADVVALPYRFTLGQAAFPGSVLEAMWLGVPLVTTQLPLLSELLTSEHTALLARAGDARDLGEKVTRLLQDRALAARLAEAQRSLAHERLEPGSVARLYVNAYEQVLARQTGVLQPA